MRQLTDSLNRGDETIDKGLSIGLREDANQGGRVAWNRTHLLRSRFQVILSETIDHLSPVTSFVIVESESGHCDRG